MKRKHILWDICVSKSINRGYAKPEKPSNVINSEFGDWDAFLAPDESYIIFCSNGRSDGFGESDLYITSEKRMVTGLNQEIWVHK